MTSRLLARTLGGALLIFNGLWLAGCASAPAPEDQSEAQLYQAAEEALDDERYQTALQNLQDLESRFPFGDYAEQVQLELIYVNYQNENYEAARATASRFIRLHPDHSKLDYAYYVKGLAAWRAGRYALESLDLVDLSQRDPGATREAYDDFLKLVQRFPNSDYASDARQRMRYLKNLLARQEVYIGQFYLRRGAPEAAIGRGRTVLQGYQDTPALPDAIAVMAEGYEHLKLQDQADKMIKLLRQVDPQHPQLTAQGFQMRYPPNQPDKTFWQIITFDLID
ncbi:outer membrane protein assembly factor BamD [Terasakiispira papahanaumokuakeensis]|uniref:outer membrane protein assembly factor BamD n=1 Tax=Terasakiispira papahanaumokuakeensis TaxID=197479 RepID=UPI000A063597|nr:outer membrane protein assembly factor BamD [Terasakiispira papahanaumokuakeensis]